jgi:translation initiation factor 4E
MEIVSNSSMNSILSKLKTIKIILYYILMNTPTLHDEGKFFRAWSFWNLIPDLYTMRENDWKDYLHSLSTFNTISGFWSIVNSVEPVNRLPRGCRYYIFKAGTTPLWEDKANSGGFEVSLEKKIQKGKKTVNDKWLNVVSSLIGETLKNSEWINGIEITVRAETYRISLWIAQTEEAIIKSIGEELQRVVKWGSELKISNIPLLNH